jgi:hypothetical protein
MKEGEAVAVGPEEEVLPKTVQNALLEHGGYLPSPDRDMVCPPWALKRHQGHLGPRLFVINSVTGDLGWERL